LQSSFASPLPLRLFGFFSGVKKPKPLHSHDRSPIKYFLQIKEHYRVNMKDYSRNMNLIFFLTPSTICEGFALDFAFDSMNISL
jgi:hypothetical protein